MLLNVKNVHATVHGTLYLRLVCCSYSGCFAEFKPFTNLIPRVSHPEVGRQCLRNATTGAAARDAKDMRSRHRGLVPVASWGLVSGL